jgi:hypothetical protein
MCGKLFETQRNGFSGSPRVAGSTICSITLRQFRMLLEDRLPASPGATVPAAHKIAARARLGLQFALALQDGLRSDSQGFGYCPHSSPPKRKRFIGRPQPGSSFSQMRLQPLIFFSHQLFPFLPHFPIQAQLLLFAASPILVGHQWGSSLLQGLPVCFITRPRICPA